MATVIKENNKSFIIEQEDDSFITIKRTTNNKNYEVDIMLFTKSDIDEFRKLQDSIYEELLVGKEDLLKKLLLLLKRFKESKSHNNISSIHNCSFCSNKL